MASSFVKNVKSQPNHEKETEPSEESEAEQTVYEQKDGEHAVYMYTVSHKSSHI